MAIINKIRIGSTTHDIAASPDSTNTFVSEDVNSSSTWVDVAALVSEETNGSIFNKVSKMFRNIRFLNSILGSGFSTSNTVASQMNNKVSKGSKLAIGQLPVNGTMINSTAYIPTSALVFDLNNRIITLKNQLGV